MPVAGSHTRTVPSPPAEASNRPSGLNATAFTQLVWPVRVACPERLRGRRRPHVVDHQQHLPAGQRRP